MTSRSDALTAAGSIAVDEIINSLRSGKSPVEGQDFDPLSTPYARKFKNGNTTPNLNLKGKLWEAIESDFFDDVLVVGVNKDEEDKASGHNQFPGGEHPWLPTRRFIPDEGESFKFTEAIRSVIDLFTVDIEEVLQEVRRTPLKLPKAFETKIIDRVEEPKPKSKTLPETFIGVEGASEKLIKNLLESPDDRPPPGSLTS